jgi:hypothetical protein
MIVLRMRVSPVNDELPSPVSTCCASLFGSVNQWVAEILEIVGASNAPEWGARIAFCPLQVRLRRKGSGNLAPMSEANPLEELRARIGEALRASPAQDLEKNLHALLGAFFDRFDLAAREDLEVQKKLLERAQAKLAALEARVAELEARKP